jgi:hypothetical protein
MSETPRVAETLSESLGSLQPDQGGVHDLSVDQSDMRTDFYTKTILTVIATCLVWLCIQPMVSPEPASAQSAQRVVIVGIDDISLLANGKPALPVTIVGGSAQR